MVFVRRICVALMTLVLGTRAFCAAAVTERTFEMASKAFADMFWENAEEDFGNFVRDHRDSPRVPEAILYQAEARFYMHRYSDAVSLLSTNQANAGTLGDLYLYWIAESQYQNSNYTAAADAFGRVARLFSGSTNRLRASVGEAAAFAQSDQWSRTIELLQDSGGVFQQLSKTVPNDPNVAFGYLLLGEAQLAETNVSGGETALEALDKLKLSPELNWRRIFLKCRLQEVQGRLEDALTTASNLVAAAGVLPQPHSQAEADAMETDRGIAERFRQTGAGAFRAESLSLLGSIQERLGEDHLDSAIETYQQLIFTNAPSSQQGRALVKIADLRLKQGNIGQAIETLQQFLDKLPRPRVADVALLKLGELQLRQYLVAAGGSRTNGNSGALTNLLGQALGRFDSLLNTYSNSPVAGKAFLGKGWCLWMSGEYTQSETAFQRAAMLALEPENQAVARFKWADAQFRQGDFAGALTNYNFLVEHCGREPRVARDILEPALYQVVRCAFEVNDTNSASSAMQRILSSYPDGFAADRGLLLTGEGYARQNNPSQAREYFNEFEKRFPNSPFLPEVQLAVARTYEQERKWADAIASYEAWTNRFPKHPRLPEAEFYRALDYSMAGEETNALASFTNFVARFPTNLLAQQAQWWIASHYFAANDNLNAELNYQRVYLNTNWPVSKLNYQAQLMAGLSAVARLSPDAIRDYFQPLAQNTNCPADLRAQARLEWGDALMSRDSTNRLEDLRQAVTVFSRTNELGPKALIRMGNAYLQIAGQDAQQAATHFDSASNCYWQASVATNATVATRNQAEVGLGVVAETRAQKLSADRNALLKEALTRYLSVFNDEGADASWRRDSGLRLSEVAETLGEWGQSIGVLKRMKDLFPEMRASLDNRIARAFGNSTEQGRK